MSSFMKGMTFTMAGKEYKVLADGGNDPSSSLVCAPLNDIADPVSIRMWKAEAKLACGDILLNGYADAPLASAGTFPPQDPLQQIAALKKRILAIEKRRISLLKINDPAAKTLIHDNVVRLNTPFAIWTYASKPLPNGSASCRIQYIKLRGLLASIGSPGVKRERFWFNIQDQSQPEGSESKDILSAESRLKIDLAPGMRTIEGLKSGFINELLEGRIELAVEIASRCHRETGSAYVAGQITHAAYIRNVHASGLTINNLVFPQLGNRQITLDGIGLDIYADLPPAHPLP